MSDSWNLILLTAAIATAPLLLLMAFGRSKKSFAGKHVLITGGSTGIGLALAKELIQLDANITIAARTQSKLEDAKREVEEVIRSKGLRARVQTATVDVKVFEQVSKLVHDTEQTFGPVDYAISSAGLSYPGRFLAQEINLFEDSMQLNYFGSLYLSKAVVPGMVERGGGHILFVISPLAAAGISGFSTYCPAKAAVRALSDVLRNELAGTGVTTSLGYPLDTDTPGYHNENLTKPPESEAISRFGAGPVLSAEQVAKSLVKGIQRGDYHIKTPDFIVNLLISSMSSITPRPYFLPLEMLMAPIVVALQAIYRKIVDGFVLRQRRREAKGSSQSS